MAEFGPSFDEVFSRVFQTRPQIMTHARRGDICKYTDREPHLGVVTMAHAAVMKEDGLAFVPLDVCECCWRIG